MTKRISQRDIAERLGIHQSTVSCILNGYNIDRFDANTRNRVINLAQRLGYRRSRQALLLRGHRSRLVGVLNFGGASSVEHKRLRALCRVLWERQYFPLPMDVNWFTYSADPVCELLIDQHVEGVVFSGFGDQFEAYHLDLLKKAGLPIEICMGVRPQGCNYSDVNRQDAFAQLTAGLIRAGRTLPALLTRESTILENTVLRPDRESIKGYLQGMATAGLDPSRALYLSVPQQVEGHNSFFAAGRTGMAELMERRIPPDAVLCHNDQMAAGALAYCRDAGLRVPDDVAVTGFGDEEFGTVLSPTLTTFSLPIEQLAIATIGRLLSQIDAGEPVANPQPLLHACELVVRESCGMQQAAVAGGGGERKPTSLIT